MNSGVDLASSFMIADYNVTELTQAPSTLSFNEKNNQKISAWLEFQMQDLEKEILLQLLF